MSQQYIATFFTHFDATKYARDLHRENIEASPAPVPRELSSSCGTCVKFVLTAQTGDFTKEIPTGEELDQRAKGLPGTADLEQLFRVAQDGSYDVLLDQR